MPKAYLRDKFCRKLVNKLTGFEKPTLLSTHAIIENSPSNFGPIASCHILFLIDYFTQVVWDTNYYPVNIAVDINYYPVNIAVRN